MRLDRFYLRLLIAATIGLWALSIRRLLPPKLLGGSDLATFRAAAWAVQHGHNPYLRSVMSMALAATHAPTYFPPAAGIFVFPLWVTVLFFWAPFAPFNLAYAIWSAISIALVGCSLAWLAKWAGWPSVAGLAVLGAATYSAFLGYDLGQVDAVVLFGVAAGIDCATRHQWFWAGVAVAAAVCVKPQLVWPLLPFLLVLAWPQKRAVIRAFEGQLVALAALVGLGCLLQPTWPVNWLHTVAVFGRAVPGQLIDPAQLTGLLRVLPALRHLSLGIRDPVTWAVIAPTMVLMGFWGHWLIRNAGSRSLAWRDRVGWGLGLPLVWWTLADPYAHGEDILVLAPVVILLLAPSWWALTGTRSWLLCLALCTLPSGYFLITTQFAGPWSLTPVAVLWLAVAATLALHGRIAAPQRPT